ncbi:unnamed protein product [Notodromas monacha]|uniref:Uncharacterized protein n=1 Tax=Notodromas monacha TaxID=399045 RepID=A0A7R9BYD9_9CRUS|nr:unnamed protein product [Notodromas monacha]CAG0924032.1 unnamed protein product [Notodromas monacha]
MMVPLYDYIHQYYKGYQCTGIVLMIAAVFCLLSFICASALGWLDYRRAKLTGKAEALWPLHAANAVNGIVYIIAAFASPLFGIIMDKTGRNVLWCFIAIVCTLGSFAGLTFTFVNPYIPMVSVGLSYSLLASALWPMVALLLPEHQLGTAYGMLAKRDSISSMDSRTRQAMRLSQSEFSLRNRFLSRIGAQEQMHVGKPATLLNGNNSRWFWDRYATVLVDCDGVLWNGDVPVPGAAEAMNALFKSGRKIIYVTNNTARTRSQYVERLLSMNFPACEDDIFTPASVAAHYLKTLNFESSVYCLGTSVFREELDAVGINSTGFSRDEFSCDSAAECLREVIDFELCDDIGAVLVGVDPFFSVPKMIKAVSYAARPGVLLLASCDEGRAPFDIPGKIVPSSGAYLAAIEKVTERKATILGKPSVEMLDCIRKKHKIQPCRTLMIGDNCRTDVLFGRNCGIDTLLVLSGVSTRDELKGYEENKENDFIPDFYAFSLRGITEKQ